MATPESSRLAERVWGYGKDGSVSIAGWLLPSAQPGCYFPKQKANQLRENNRCFNWQRCLENGFAFSLSLSVGNSPSNSLSLASPSPAEAGGLNIVGGGE